MRQVNSIKVYSKSSKTVYFLPLILAFLYFTGSQPFNGQVIATQKALAFGLAFSTLLAALYLPDGLIRRPSVYLWKSITGIGFFYLAVLIYFVYLDRDTAVSTIRTYFDPRLERFDYEEVSYAGDCRLYAAGETDPFMNVRYAFFDLFAFAHAAGWFIKTLVVRDFKMVLFHSIVFELIEYSLRNVLNNFKECWWDHIIVDVLGCNLLGIILGFYVIDKFKLERYRWSFRDAPLNTGAWEQFKYFLTHWDLSQLEMKSFAGLKKFMQLAWFCFFFQLNDLSVFFLKYIYQIPPSNYMVIARVLVIGLMGVNSSKEFYRYLVRRENNFKINIFLVHMIVLTELFLILKHGKSQFEHAHFTPLAKLYLSLLVLLFLGIAMKVLISDVINYRKPTKVALSPCLTHEKEKSKLKTDVPQIAASQSEGQHVL